MSILIWRSNFTRTSESWGQCARVGRIFVSYIDQSHLFIVHCFSFLHHIMSSYQATTKVLSVPRSFLAIVFSSSSGHLLIRILFFFVKRHIWSHRHTETNIFWLKSPLSFFIRNLHLLPWIRLYIQVHLSQWDLFAS